MLNLSQYYSCSKDQENQIDANNGRLLLAIIFSDANIAFEAH
jgi:hypothetical protein